MITLRVKDRGRDLAVHKLERLEEAEELMQVYCALGFPIEKIVVERASEETPRAA